jgi:hypothetical protein
VPNMKPSEINLLTTPRGNRVLTTFSLATLETTFWDDVSRQSAQRGRPDVSPFSRKVAASVFDACLWALRDRQTDNRSTELSQPAPAAASHRQQPALSQPSSRLVLGPQSCMSHPT